MFFCCATVVVDEEEEFDSVEFLSFSEPLESSNDSSLSCWVRRSRRLARDATAAMMARSATSSREKQQHAVVKWGREEEVMGLEEEEEREDRTCVGVAGVTFRSVKYHGSGGSCDDAMGKGGGEGGEGRGRKLLIFLFGLGPKH